MAHRLGGKPHCYVTGTVSRSSSPVETSRLSTGVHMVLPILAEPLPPRDGQGVAGAIEDAVRCIQDEAEDRRAGGQQVIVQGRQQWQQHRCIDEPGCVFSEGQVGVIAGWKLLNLAWGYRR